MDTRGVDEAFGRSLRFSGTPCITSLCGKPSTHAHHGRAGPPDHSARSAGAETGPLDRQVNFDSGYILLRDVEYFIIKFSSQCDGV
jgi:hypothetical protein